MPPWGNAYFDPNSLYGSPVDYSTAPVVAGPGGYLGQNPSADWTRTLGRWGIGGGNDAFSTWLRNQYGRAYQGYQGALATNPNLLFGHGQGNYLQGLGPQFFQNQWNRFAPEQRGLNQPRFGAGRTQWARM